MFIVCLFWCCLMFDYNKSCIKIENIIYELYYDSFKDYLTIDSNNRLLIDNEGLQKYFVLKNYAAEIFFKNNIVKIKFKLNNIFEKEKVFSFYMVRNDEYK